MFGHMSMLYQSVIIWLILYLRKPSLTLGAKFIDWNHLCLYILPLTIILALFLFLFGPVQISLVRAADSIPFSWFSILLQSQLLSKYLLPSPYSRIPFCIYQLQWNDEWETISWIPPVTAMKKWYMYCIQVFKCQNIYIQQIAHFA